MLSYIETTTNLEGSLLLDKALSSILSKWPNHCSIPSCIHFIISFNFSLVLSSFAEILSSGLTLNIHLTILASLLSSLITSSSLTGQVSLLFSITLRTYAEYDLPFAPMGKLLLAKKGTKSYLLHPFMILVPEKYLEPSRTFTIFFAKIFHGF